jgi:hypothetical protein
LDFNIIIPLLLALFKFAPVVGGPKGGSASSSGTKGGVGGKTSQLEEMFPVTFFVTEANGGHKEFELQLKYISEGGFGKVSKQPVISIINSHTFCTQVFHAYPENWAEFVGDPAADVSDGQQQHCAALKVAIKDEQDQWTESPQEVVLGNEINILRQFAKLENGEQRRHLVKLYHEGQVYAEGKTIPNKAYAMELGEEALNNYLSANEGKLTNENIEEVAKDIALAIRDFHRGR